MFSTNTLMYYSKYFWILKIIMNENNKRENRERKTSLLQCSKKHITSEQELYPECGIRGEQGVRLEIIYVWA